MATFYEQRPERLFIGEMTHSTFPAHVHSEAELVILARGSAVMTIDSVPYRAGVFRTQMFERSPNQAENAELSTSSSFINSS